MIGFAIGAACLAGLVFVGRHGRACGAGGCGHQRWHHHYRHHHHHHGRGWGRARGFGERAAMRWLFEELDTTHGQEKVIMEAWEELRGPVRKAREELLSTFDELGRAVGAESFDHARTAETWVRQDKALEQVRLSLTTALARVHEALDERQRKILGELLARRGAVDWA